VKNPIHMTRQFYLDTVLELKKCTWPTRQELVESTVVVIISVAILAVFVLAIDTVGEYLIRWLIGGL